MQLPVSARQSRAVESGDGGLGLGFGVEAHEADATAENHVQVVVEQAVADDGAVGREDVEELVLGQAARYAGYVEVGIFLVAGQYACVGDLFEMLFC